MNKRDSAPALSDFLQEPRPEARRVKTSAVSNWKTLRNTLIYSRCDERKFPTKDLIFIRF